MATNSPAVPWITLRSRTTKHPSSVMLTYAFSFSSSTGKIFTSVMSMAAPRCGEHPLGIGQKSSTTAYPACEQTEVHHADPSVCLLYTSDAADERSSVDLGGRRIIKKKKG